MQTKVPAYNVGHCTSTKHILAAVPTPALFHTRFLDFLDVVCTSLNVETKLVEQSKPKIKLSCSAREMPTVVCSATYLIAAHRHLLHVGLSFCFHLFHVLIGCLQLSLEVPQHPGGILSTGTRELL